MSQTDPATALQEKIRQARDRIADARRRYDEAEARKQQIRAASPTLEELQAELDALRDESKSAGQPLPRTIWGVTAFHSETGTEGGRWAVQDVLGIDVSRRGEPGSWSYYGLHTLTTGDHLTIYAPESVAKDRGGALTWEPEVLWEGEIRLQHHELFTEHAHGWWIHADQADVERDRWASFFLREHPCRLLTHRQPEVIGEQRLPEGECEGLFLERPRRLYFMADGTVRWRLRAYPRLADGWSVAPRPLLEYIHAQRST